MKEILDYYDVILNGDKILNPASYFEWNTYRVFWNLGDFLEIKPNFALDEQGYPIGIAKPGVEDILIIYRELSLLVECSLRTGNSQLDTEGDSVVRHLEKYKETNRHKCAFSLFLCSDIDLSFAKHISFDKENTPIIPLTVQQFKRLVRYFVKKGFSSLILKETLSKILRPDLGYREVKQWLEYIGETVNELNVEEN